jgi:molecular chaperone DnaJ
VIDFYVVLGLDREATLGDVKRAYRRLARRYHPGINPGDRKAEAEFRRISEAYETLSDPDRRRRYDAAGPSPEPPVEAPAIGFAGFDFSVTVSGAEAPTFGDLFADVLRARAANITSGEPVRGADLHQTLTISFENAARGGEHRVSLTRQEHCSLCRGIGRLPVAERECPNCQGIGAMTSTRGHMVFTRPCLQCRGTGRQTYAACPRCGGHQMETHVEVLTIALAPGLDDGSRVRVPGKGHAGRYGGEPGDLYVTVHVEPHAQFRREGDDLHVIVPLAVHEAALGTKLEVPTLDGVARLRVPPGTQSGQRFRLRERGIPSPRDGRRGDLVVEVRLMLPPVLDERSKELLREFGRINGSGLQTSGSGPAQSLKPEA